MTKSLVAFFLLLSSFLLSGYSQQYAYQDCSPYASQKNTEGSHHVTIENNRATVLSSASYNIKKENFEIDVTGIEEKDELELISSKVHLGYSYSIAIFCAHKLGYFSFYLKKSLPFYKHFSYRSSYEGYLKFLAIRI